MLYCMYCISVSTRALVKHQKKVTPHIIQHYLCTLSVTVMVMGDLKEGEERDRERGKERRGEGVTTWGGEGLGRRGRREGRKERRGRAEEEDDGRERERPFSTDFSRANGFFNGLYCTVL